mmetsp:Transcript_22884/g.49494  ORF Transcript_22884/g.49494 Transcript_22884/m.49494 type:complete len:94 (+) Transcript_22884:1279-1560(+)
MSLEKTSLSAITKRVPQGSQWMQSESTSEMMVWRTMGKDLEASSAEPEQLLVLSLLQKVVIAPGVGVASREAGDPVPDPRPMGMGANKSTFEL